MLDNYTIFTMESFKDSKFIMLSSLLANFVLQLNVDETEISKFVYDGGVEHEIRCEVSTLLYQITTGLSSHDCYWEAFY